ncbi:MAG TPA: neutral/alkaline non-lysosomal ceramidase N-terminal domain-containing protein [Tepidiformaceae bacterium]|nr:neutral/alkaline non-lysosomal ceramidase N-terminal domain-containing protein [Tepidiformaceae bacterium]
MLRIGACRIDITPPVGTPLDGYGGRLDVSLGVHDPLYARCLYLDDGRTQLALVVGDLIGVGRRLVERSRELVAERPGIPPGNVLVAATHTHAGPAGIRGTGEPALVEIVARQIAGAVRVAHRNAVEGRLKYGHTELSSIAQNRRDPDWPIDHRLDVVAADTADGKNIATVARYACHPTTMERENLDISAEWPGECCRVIEQVIGGDTLGIYLNGACGNINPAWMWQRFDEVHRVGSIVGAKAAALSQELRPLGINHQAHNIRWDELTTKPVTAGRLAGDAPLKVARQTFDAPYRTGPADEEIARRIADLEREQSSSDDATRRREVTARLTRARSERLALARIQGRGPVRPEEVQAMRLGSDLFLIALPGEVFVETQEEIRARSGIENLLVVAYANDYPGYFCRADAYEQGGYEAGVTPFAPEADGMLVAAALAALQEVT